MNKKITRSVPSLLRSQDDAAGIAGRQRSRSSCLDNGQEFSVLQVVQSGSGAYTASPPVGTGDFSSGIKRPGREAGHSPPTSAEVKKTFVCTSTPPYTFVV
jgi:hypothetical protein